MKKSRYSDSQIMDIIQQNESDASIIEIAQSISPMNGLNGPASTHPITLLYVQPGKPMQHAYIEPFNRKASHEEFDLNLF